MVFARMITFGFLASIFAMFRFGKYCRLLNTPKWRLEPEEEARYQAGAQRWGAAAACLLAVSVLLIILGIIRGIIVH